MSTVDVHAASESVSAVYPADNATLALLFKEPVSLNTSEHVRIESKAGMTIESVRLDRDDPRKLWVKTSSMQVDGVIVDSLRIHADLRIGREGIRQAITPRFIHGIKTPTELRAVELEPTFPFSSRLHGIHVTVACCTGCDGGIHDRDLVVLNSHVGGPWTGIWVRTHKTIEAPYPRWQKIVCAGGVLASAHGSLIVSDEGWMEIRKEFEVPHHAPPPLPVTCAQIPSSTSRSLLSRGLDASWVEFSDVTVEAAVIVPAPEGAQDVRRLKFNRIDFTDRSGGTSRAFLYQPSGLKVAAGTHLKKLRGFVHAEEPDAYVVLSDKEEDIAS